ncbi:MAG: UDP-N-acetylmuramate--L-alanine ligase [Lachnospiraceae bacterium]|nr:UDP-N-acetylmuramate--L-alanine ligase [Lachnospiraceae bacterium]
MEKIDFNSKKHIHFIGIGGISMSGLAELLLKNGFTVSGSDRDESDLTKKLAEMGAVINTPQKAENITDDIDLVVYTAAIHPDNPEFMAVEQKGLPKVTRAEFLGSVMQNYRIPIAISGTHGKTTTTSMISEIMLISGSDPTISVGGILPSINGNFRTGGRDIFITEACEYTNSFLSLNPKIGIILNIEADHLDFFKDLDDIRHSFREFARLLPDDGVLIINGEVENISYITDGLKCKVITYGLNKSFDVYADNISYGENGCAEFDLNGIGDSPLRISLMVPGEHNIGNSLAAAAAAHFSEAPEKDIIAGLSSFTGTKRRFEVLGPMAANENVTVIDDYAHHPTEIKATLTAASKRTHNSIWAVFQPHTYTRTKALLDDFVDAFTLTDHLVMADIYAARETDTLGVSSELLAEKAKDKGIDAYYFPSFEEIENFLKKNCVNGDLLITIGAGDVDKIGHALVKK